MAREAHAEELTKAQCADANEHASVLRSDDHLLAARAELERCRSASCPGPVRDDCVAQLAEIETLMPELRFRVHAPDGTEIPEVAVTIAGASRAMSVRAERIAVDPGYHLFEFRAAGFQPATRRLLVLRSTKDLIDLQLEPLTPTSAGAAGANQHDPAQRRDTTALDSAPVVAPRALDRQWAAIGLAGAGIIASIAGAYFGFHAKDTYDWAVLDSCGGRVDACTQAGVDRVGRAQTQADVSTLLFVGSLVTIAAATLLLVTSPEPAGKQGSSQRTTLFRTATRAP